MHIWSFGVWKGMFVVDQKAPSRKQVGSRRQKQKWRKVQIAKNLEEDSEQVN